MRSLVTIALDFKHVSQTLMTIIWPNIYVEPYYLFSNQYISSVEYFKYIL
jgi:hypothetical protein